MTRLSVNVNKIATLRNARGKNTPHVLKTTLNAITFGAQGITVHPRPDERHIRKQDVYDIARHIDVEFNIEGYPSDDFLALIEDIKPAQCTLVPDPPHVLTSNAGWAIQPNVSFLKDIVSTLRTWQVRSSLFIDPFTLASSELSLLKEIGPDRVELYTESYAEAFGTPNEANVLHQFEETAKHIQGLEIGLNAGHDLNLENLRPFLERIPFIEEVSIGHALICDALYFGLEQTIKKYLACLPRPLVTPF